jgi:hypothetical protein
VPAKKLDSSDAAGAGAVLFSWLEELFPFLRKVDRVLTLLLVLAVIALIIAAIVWAMVA